MSVKNQTDVSEILLSSIPSASIVPKDRAQDLLTRVAARHDINPDLHYWWSSLVDARRIDYANSLDKWCIELSQAIHSSCDDGIYLVITDDEPAPWPVIWIADPSSVVTTLSELHFFEYFFISKNYSKLIFDTHHNFLVISEKKDHPLDRPSNLYETSG